MSTRNNTDQLRTWILIVVVLIVGVVVAYYAWQFGTKLDWDFIFQHFFDTKLMQGAQMTLFLSVSAQIAGILLGLLAALMKLSNSPIRIVNIVLRGIANFYIWLFRGTPLLVQLIIFATGLYEVGIKLDLITAALLALSLNEGAYMAEIVRAGIQSVDPGQMEAAKSLGMTYGLGMRRIVLPQALRVILPPTGNEFNNMLKSSSLASVISVGELLQHAGDLNHLYFKTMETFTIASCYYLAMTTVWTWVQGKIEKRLGTRDIRVEQNSFWNRLRNNVVSTRSTPDHA
jgi:polar amino acid transport system permease protein